MNVDYVDREPHVRLYLLTFDRVRRSETPILIPEYLRKPILNNALAEHPPGSLPTANDVKTWFATMRARGRVCLRHHRSRPVGRILDVHLSDKGAVGPEYLGMWSYTALPHSIIPEIMQDLGAPTHLCTVSEPTLNPIRMWLVAHARLSLAYTCTAGRASVGGFYCTNFRFTETSLTTHPRYPGCRIFIANEKIGGSRYGDFVDATMDPIPDPVIDPVAATTAAAAAVVVAPDPDDAPFLALLTNEFGAPPPGFATDPYVKRVLDTYVRPVYKDQITYAEGGAERVKTAAGGILRALRVKEEETPRMMSLLNMIAMDCSMKNVWTQLSKLEDGMSAPSKYVKVVNSTTSAVAADDCPTMTASALEAFDGLKKMRAMYSRGVIPSD